jgi:hypothetical protein
MHWQLQPLIIVLLLGTLALLAIPRVAHPQTASPAIRKACDGDIRTLCPKEYAMRRGRAKAICLCMNERGGAFTVSLACQRAWIKEHGMKKGECK